MYDVLLFLCLIVCYDCKCHSLIDLLIKFDGNICVLFDISLAELS